jgi:hypothetical protein
MDKDPLIPSVKTLEWVDESMILLILNAAAATPEPIDLNRKSALLHMLWKTDDERILTPLIYMPRVDGLSAQVLMQKSLLTGDCRDAATPVAAPITPELAEQLETMLGSHLLISDEWKAPWRLYATHCQTYVRGHQQ